MLQRNSNRNPDMIFNGGISKLDDPDRNLTPSLIKLSTKLIMTRLFLKREINMGHQYSLAVKVARPMRLDLGSNPTCSSIPMSLPTASKHNLK